MTVLAPPPIETPPSGPTDERPSGGRGFDRATVMELGVPAVAAAALVWVPFHLAGLDAPFGFLVCWFVAFCAGTAIIAYQQHGLLAMKDRLATIVIMTGAGIALLPVFLIVYFVLTKGLSTVLSNFPHFLTHDLRTFGPTDPLSRAGMKHAIIGTIEQVGIATIITVPIGVLTAAYLNEVGGRYAAVVRTVADAMTGLPTIIAGLFIYYAWVKGPPKHGFSGFAGAMALAIVMLPTIVRTSEEVLRIVSDNLREAALALGSPEWKMILSIVLPTARAGLVTASILGVARGVGETAPVYLTAFGSHVTNLNPFHGPQSSLTLQVYEFVRANTKSNVDVAWGGALLLVTIVLTLFALARILGSGGAGSRRAGRGVRLPSFARRR